MKLRTILVTTSVLAATSCASPGEINRADSYTADQVNTRQEAKVVNILAILPAKVQVSNEQNRRLAQIGGALLGGLGAGLGVGVGAGASPGLSALAGLGGAGAGAGAGSLVPGNVMVAGVSLTYTQDGHTFNSTQVGKACEFKMGQAIMVQTSPEVTRIQPNATCVKGK